jgi:hypothetical protein
MRLNSRTWPVWMLVAATVWFVAVVAFWAVRPLTDHVPTTVAHTPTQQEIDSSKITGIAAPIRVAGPTVAVQCPSPASSASRDLAAERAVLAGLVDGNGVPFVAAQFERVPCAGPHRQAHYLWYANTALYVLVVGAVAAVFARRRRHRHVPESAFATA